MSQEPTQPKPVILFKLESGKHIYTGDYDKSSRIHGLHRFNGELELTPNQTYNTPVTVIPLDIITKIEHISTHQELSGHKVGDSIYTIDTYDNLIKSLVLDFDYNDNPICASIENFNEYKRIQSMHSPIYTTITSYHNVDFVIEKLPTASEFIIPMWHMNLSKLDLYKFNKLAYAIKCCHDCASKYGYVFVGDITSRDKEWSHSTHNGLEYLKINGAYYGDRSMNYTTAYIGTIVDIDKQIDEVNKKITDAFRNSHMKYEIISDDTITVKSVYDEAHRALVSVSKIDSKKSTESERKDALAYITSILKKLEGFQQ